MKLIKVSVIVFLTFVTISVFAQINFPLGGNVFSNKKQAKQTISNNGIKNWQDPEEVFTAYFRVSQPGDFKITLQQFKIIGTATLSFTVQKQAKQVELNSHSQPIEIGTWHLKDTGYIAIAIKGIKKSGETFPSINSLSLSGTATLVNPVFVKSNDDNLFYFGRRGPSTHLNYLAPEKTDVEWFYNEVTVPKGEDKLGTYFMANGFGEGYFGIQVNSPTERRVLFSVWSPFSTDDPKEIPADHQIKLIKKGENVQAGEFGGEGSGGQSRMLFNWKAGSTYRFLVRIKPIENGYSEYTAYFFAPEINKWQLIACFQRPQTQTYAKHLYSFLECFDPDMGDVSRVGTYNNQWVCDTKGNWTELTKAYFTYDNTAAKGYRKDYQGGIDKNGGFYLKIDGFFNEFTPYKKLLTRKPSNRKPLIDFSKLP